MALEVPVVLYYTFLFDELQSFDTLAGIISSLPPIFV
jgi:hypothetical protein